MALNIDGNTPNSVLEQYNVLTSYDEGLGQDAGYGSLKERSVATEVALYKPFDNAMDTFIQLFGGFDTVTNYKHEWLEEDDYLPDLAVGNGPRDQADVINNTTGATAYSPASQAKFDVSKDDARIFRKGDRVRYVDTNGAYTQALVKSVANIDDSNSYMVLESIVGSNLPEAGKNSAKIERMDALRGSDRNYDPEPRGKMPTLKETLIRKIVHDDSYTPRVKNTAHLLDLLSRKEDDLFKELRRSRILGCLYGEEGTVTLENSDRVYSSAGLWNQIKGKNLHSLETGGATFDPETFKDSMYDMIEFCFGAESGGPNMRQCFVSGKFASYLSRAFEGSQRFYGNEFVAGVRTMRWEHNLGVIDFVHAPIFEYKHPLVGGSLREGSGKAVGLLLPVEQTAERLVFQNEGPRSWTFKEKGGDEEEIMRVKTTEGLKASLLQYTCAIEEA